MIIEAKKRTGVYLLRKKEVNEDCVGSFDIEKIEHRFIQITKTRNNIRESTTTTTTAACLGCFIFCYDVFNNFSIISRILFSFRIIKMGFIIHRLEVA